MRLLIAAVSLVAVFALVLVVAGDGDVRYVTRALTHGDPDTLAIARALQASSG
ncbi:hypothetical protein [Pseudonocardia pini]|uniref:hypothetical protein n=1 Tax=Pseudonocardia pini TaxID=2758030 RepID=UPI0015F120CE|nr:hypothetical protein [Pseudonocardia pini]